MENRFEHSPEEEEEKGWGAYATPPPTSPGASSGRLPDWSGLAPGGQEAMLSFGAKPHKTLCSRVQEMLPSLLEADGDIRPEMAASLFAHLSVCPACQREFNEMQRVVSLLEALPVLETPLDYSGSIMRRIQLEGANQSASARSLPVMTPAPHTASDAISGTIQNNLTNRAGQQTQNITNTQSVNTRLNHSALGQTQVTRSRSMLQQFLASAVGLALLILFLSLDWGRQMLGANLQAAGEMLAQISETLKQVPVLGSLVAGIATALSQASVAIGEAYHTLGTQTAQMLAIDAAVCAAACWMVAARRQRAARIRI